MKQVANPFIPKPKAGEKRHKITVSELSLILQKIDGSSPTAIFMVTRTDAKLKKTGNPYRDEVVLKSSSYIARVNVNYTNAVNNQLEREGKERDFQAQENWHAKKYDSYNGCVAMKAEGDKKQEYLFFVTDRVKRNGFLLNGKQVKSQVEIETIKQFLPTYSAPTNQGTEKAIQVQTIKLENISLLKLKGKIYEIVQQ